MDLPDLKKLDKLITLCRKRGISTVKMGDLELTLGDAPAPKAAKALKEQDEKPSLGVEGVQSEILQGDDLLFWSTGLLPDDSDHKQQ